MRRLSWTALDALPPDVVRPRYDRGAVQAGVVHLGVGAFHRAHQAAYFDTVLGQGARDWAILGASLRRPDMRDALAPQDGLYSLRETSGAGDSLRVVGSVTGVRVAPEDPAALVAALADPRVRLVTLTVTEKGYLHNPATGALDPAHPDLAADQARPDRPVSAVGFLVAGLAARRAAGCGPFTVLSCDNLPDNGALTRGVTLAHARLRDAGLADWIAGEAAFPSCMVDRIVPAAVEADRAAAAAALGLEDAAPVAAEPFTQWVVEDRFCAGRPPLEDAGVQMVADVAPYERMKLRLLNGAHSTLAYLGYLAGRETVADAMADPPLARLIEGLMRCEAAPTLTMPAGADVGGYVDALLERFRNPALRHRTWQIAMDGSQKLPQRLLATAQDRLAAGGAIDRLALGVAAWMRYVAGRDDRGAPIDVRDPLAARLRAVADAAGGDPRATADGFLGVSQVFDPALAGDPRFAGPVRAALTALSRDGAARTVATLDARLGRAAALRGPPG